MKKGEAMDDAEMDRILSRPDEIVPSSGFAASVMEAVYREAAAPPPIPFPWKRALPCVGLAAAALILTSIVIVVAVTHLSAGSVPSNPVGLGLQARLLTEGGLGSAIAWTALALIAAFVSVKLSLRLAGDRP